METMQQFNGVDMTQVVKFAWIALGVVIVTVGAAFRWVRG